MPTKSKSKPKSSKTTTTKKISKTDLKKLKGGQTTAQYYKSGSPISKGFEYPGPSFPVESITPDKPQK